MSIRLVIFDFDGTLADSFPWFCGVLNDVARRHGFREVEPDEREQLRELGTREIMKSLRVPVWKVPAIARDMRAMKADAGISLFEGAAEALAALSARGIVLAMVSSDSEDSIKRALGPETALMFAHYRCGAGLFGKTRKLRQVLKAAGVAPEAAIYIGDETRDAEAARAAGIQFAAVTWGYAAPQALAAGKPDFVFDSFSDFARLG